MNLSDAMPTTTRIDLLDLVLSIGNAIDLMSPKMAHHHKRVAYIASAIAREMGLPASRRQEVLVAGLLHDIGALSLGERARLLQFDGIEGVDLHAHVGYLLLRKFSHFGAIAELVRHHHQPWHDGDGRWHEGCEIPYPAHLLHLADRVDVTIDKDHPILSQVEDIVATITQGAGPQFCPDAVAAFVKLSTRETFWLDVESPTLHQMIAGSVRELVLELNPDDLLDFAELLAHVIDFRSPFTATHSSGVAATAAVLAGLMGFSSVECQHMRIAGYLHDIGKLAVPSELLDKPGPLTEAEFRIIKTHVYHTFRILAPMKGLHDIIAWASLHHERLDGYGYPGRRKGCSIPLGARILAVADVFTALSEERPYRAACSRDEVTRILQEMAQRHIVDTNVVSVLIGNYGDIDAVRSHAQAAAHGEYEAFLGLIGMPRNPSWPGAGPAKDALLRCS